MPDPLESFKAMQREGWAHFAPLATFTAPCAARLVEFARVKPGASVLDVACGTGVVAVTAARPGAKVSALDLSPTLLEHARENAEIAGVAIDFREGDAESLPWADASFDFVLSQFGHIFAPRPDVVTREMLRVLKPGGTIAFSTWPPELLVGRSFLLTSRYAPPPPPGVSPPTEWGDPAIVRERLGPRVERLTFDRDTMWFLTLSPAHVRTVIEKTAAPMIKLVEMLSSKDPGKLATFRREYDELIAEYFDGNRVRQDFLMSRAVKVG